MAENEKKSPSAPKKEKVDKTKKQGGLKTWIREMKAELKNVQWPSKKDTIKHTTTVLCCVGVIGAFIWVFDYLASNVMKALIALV